MLVWNRRTKTFLWVAVASAVGFAAAWAFIGTQSAFLDAHPSIDDALVIPVSVLPIVYCVALITFVLEAGSDKSRLAVAGRWTAGLVAVLWPFLTAFILLSYSEEGVGPIDLEDLAVLAGAPIVGIIGAYIGFRRNPS